MFGRTGRRRILRPDQQHAQSQREVRSSLLAPSSTRSFKVSSRVFVPAFAKQQHPFVVLEDVDELSLAFDPQAFRASSNVIERAVVPIQLVLAEREHKMRGAIRGIVREEPAEGLGGGGIRILVVPDRPE